MEDQRRGAPHIRDDSLEDTHTSSCYEIALAALPMLQVWTVREAPTGPAIGRLGFPSQQMPINDPPNGRDGIS